jgi:hypothetical protein
MHFMAIIQLTTDSHAAKNQYATYVSIYILEYKAKSLLKIEINGRQCLVFNFNS